MENKIIEILSYTIPAIVTGTISYLLISSHFKEQKNLSNWLLKKENSKQSLTLRLQAYERMTLFLERINISKILLRISPVSTNKVDYSNLISEHIEQEFTHNLTQQLYISNESWILILTAKNQIIQILNNTAEKEDIKNATELREFLLKESLNKLSPSISALSFLKNEVKNLL